MDPLSDVLSLLKPQSYAAGGFRIDRDLAIQWPRHPGIKCYALLSGQCWLRVEEVPDPVQLTAGDCFLLPRGLPFSLATDLALQPVDFFAFRAAWQSTAGDPPPPQPATQPATEPGALYIAGGHFALTGSHADILLHALPPIVHIRNESDKAAMRWSLERMREELRDPRPGSSLIAEQLASTMLVQALRLYLAHPPQAGVGWLFALADKHMGAAISCIHADPGHPWTLHSLAARIGMSRSVFALRFRQTVGQTPMEYLTRWRMLLAGQRLRQGSESLAAIASSLGYDSESAFGKAFKRTLGSSPRQYSRAIPPPSPTDQGPLPATRQELSTEEGRWPAQTSALARKP